MNSVIKRFLFIGRGTYLNSSQISSIIRWGPSQTEKAHYEIIMNGGNHHIFTPRVKGEEIPQTYKVYQDEEYYTNVTKLLRKESDSNEIGLEHH